MITRTTLQTFMKTATMGFIVLASTLLAPRTIAAANADKPNVIVILTDDQGWGDLSVHGNTNISTPNIDRLASQGMAFDRFYVCPICSPTRASIMTGQNPARHGMTAPAAQSKYTFSRSRNASTGS